MTTARARIRLHHAHDRIGPACRALVPVSVLALAACGGGAPRSPAGTRPTESAAAPSASGLPEEDLPAVCTALESCCAALGSTSEACARWADVVAEHGVSQSVCRNVGSQVVGDGSAASASSCGPLVEEIESEHRAPLAEDEVACRTDTDCVALGAGRNEWCNAGGVIVAANHTAAAEVQARLDALPLEEIGEMPSICPLPLPRCVARACELEWHWARCESDGECVRVEQGAGEAQIANGCRAESAERLARALDPEGHRGLPRVLTEGVACVRGRCTTDEDVEP